MCGAEVVEGVGNLDAVFPAQLLVDGQSLLQDTFALLLHGEVPGGEGRVSLSADVTTQRSHSIGSYNNKLNCTWTGSSLVAYTTTPTHSGASVV